MPTLQQTEPAVANMLLRLGDDYGAQCVVDTVKKLWPGLFEIIGSFPARATDKATSQHAASRHATADVGRFRWNSIKGRVLNELVKRDLTALEAARVATGSDSAIKAETARKRVTELRQAGYIVDSGKRARNAGSPDDSVVWAITQAGRVAARRMAGNGWSK